MKQRILKVTNSVGGVKYFAQVRRRFLFISYWINVWYALSSMELHTELASMGIFDHSTLEGAKKSLEMYNNRGKEIIEVL